MNVLQKIWNNSPKAVSQALLNKISSRNPNPKWTDVKSGPLKGRQLFVDSNSFLGWKEMINGSFDSFIYDEISNYSNIEGAIFWDIGAHFGYHSFCFASLVGQKGHVYSFEPNPYNTERFEMHLEKNIILAKIITLNKYALSNIDGETSFVFSNDVDGSRSSGSFIRTVEAPLVVDQYATFKECMIKTVRIDSIMERGEILPPNIIKIDVEGAELLVLQGGKTFFSAIKPIIFMEVHNITMMFKVFEFLSEINYELRILDNYNSTLSRCYIVANPK
jgi:FkbM family methyltransferase